MTKKALLLIDLQNDFCLGGNLAVPDGDAVISIANHIQDQFDNIIVTKDWHPPNHMSFASNNSNKKIGDVITLNGLEQVLWPDHCIQNTKGAELHPKLQLKKIHHIVHKGMQPEIDSYSAFFDNGHLASTDLHDYLQKNQIQELYIMGLATDYCVKFSCLDALSLGYAVNVIREGCRGVELHKGDVLTAFQEMENKGAKIISFE